MTAIELVEPSQLAFCGCRIAALADTKQFAGESTAMRTPPQSLLIATILACAFFVGIAEAKTALEPSISKPEMARVELVAKQARDAKDITESQYRNTIAALHSKPCIGVDRSLNEAQKSTLAPLIALQQGWEHVELIQSFKLGKWQIIYLENGVSDEPYLFFPDSPSKSKSLGMWAGAATIFETGEILNWTVQNIPGIPKHLARCFAWHVTLNRN